LEQIKEFQHDEPITYYETCERFYKGKIGQINKLIQFDLEDKIKQPLQYAKDWFMFTSTDTSKND